ncbi:Glycosyltransferase 61, partial [Dillenia turbinata]
MCCDRSHNRSDICFMKGDVRTHSNSSSIILYDSTNQDMEDKQVFQHERIRPYPRKWEAHTRENVAELNLILKSEYLEIDHSCDVVHDVPALFFSTGGYTGNLFHEFNDGIVPLYITSQHLKKKVVFVIVDYHDWWFTKYADILSVLSDYPPIDFTGDNRTHCFTETIVGLRFHGDLTIDPSLMEGNKSMREFRSLLDQAYWPRIKGLIEDEQRNASLSAVVEEMPQVMLKKPRLVLISRNGSRAIMNEDSLVKLAQRVGFDVEVLVPTKTTELARVYRVLNTSDVMVGVHGAALTHFLYLKPGSVLIQVIPLGSEWASETYFEGPSKKYGLKYIGYKILPRESSLYDSYDENDPILQDPIRMSRKSWEFTKKIYLDAQDVRLDLMRFQ